MVIVKEVAWQEIKGQWEPLVKAGFHKTYCGIGEAYGDIKTLRDKLKSIEKYSEYKKVKIWGAFSENRLVGFIVGSVKSGTYTIFDIFVSKGLRKQGIGKMLVRESVRDSDCIRAQAEVRIDNLASQKLFNSIGFKKKMTVDFYVKKKA